MKPISYARHRFPPEIIRHAVWLYLRFTLSYRDVEDLMAERGLTVSNESIRRWVLKFGPLIAKNLRTIRPKAYTRWYLDEMVVSLSGKQMYIWRAVDGEGEVLEILVQPQRDKAAALRLLRKLLRRQAVDREVLSELPIGEIVSTKLALPIMIGVYLIDEDGPVLAAVPNQIPLAVAIDIESPYHAPALNGCLPNGGADGLPSPRDITRQTPPQPVASGHGAGLRDGRAQPLRQGHDSH
jgi:hypothetical protein